MNERANIAVHFDQREGVVDQRVYIYTHSMGARLALVLRDTINGRGRRRLDDDQYFARILFEEVVGEGFRQRDVDYGLSPFLCGTDLPVLVVDCTNGRVWVEDRAGEPIEGREWTIQAFGDLSDEAALAAMED